MGLSEPRKRIKLAHDPRNLQWSDNASSFGARIMQSSGWKPGTALGASSIPAHESSAAKVRITVKDDMLGLGASLKSKNVEHQRTGLDAFQGLLGRLNAKDQKELEKVEKKIENRKLAMFAQGRWGGMVFVPGGLLVQDDPKQKVEAEEKRETEEGTLLAENESDSEMDSDLAQKQEKKRKRADQTPEERAQRKAEKKERKDERRQRREAKRLKKLQKGSGTSTPSTDTADLTETSTGASTPVQIPEINKTPVTQERSRNGRHLLRGRNIQAKRMAFTDSKGLDQIFMRQQQAV